MLPLLHVGASPHRMTKGDYLLQWLGIICCGLETLQLMPLLQFFLQFS